MANGNYQMARVEHKCRFCLLPIPAGSRYWYETITPWEHEDNDGFFTLKAHTECISLWYRVCDLFEGCFPDDPHEWRRMLAESEEERG